METLTAHFWHYLNSIVIDSNFGSICNEIEVSAWFATTHKPFTSITKYPNPPLNIHTVNKPYNRTTIIKIPPNPPNPPPTTSPSQTNPHNRPPTLTTLLQFLPLSSPLKPQTSNPRQSLNLAYAATTSSSLKTVLPFKKKKWTVGFGFGERGGVLGMDAGWVGWVGAGGWDEILGGGGLEDLFSFLFFVGNAIDRACTWRFHASPRPGSYYSLIDKQKMDMWDWLKLWRCWSCRWWDVGERVIEEEDYARRGWGFKL